VKGLMWCLRLVRLVSVYVLDVDVAVKERRFILKPPSHIEAVTGSNVTLECAAGGGGKPAPHLTWRRHSGSSLPHHRHTRVLGMCDFVCMALYIGVKTFLHFVLI